MVELDSRCRFSRSDNTLDNGTEKELVSGFYKSDLTA